MSMPTYVLNRFRSLPSRCPILLPSTVSCVSPLCSPSPKDSPLLVPVPQLSLPHPRPRLMCTRLPATRQPWIWLIRIYIRISGHCQNNYSCLSGYLTLSSPPAMAPNTSFLPCPDPPPPLPTRRLHSLPIPLLLLNLNHLVVHGHCSKILRVQSVWMGQLSQLADLNP